MGHFSINTFTDTRMLCFTDWSRWKHTNTNTELAGNDKHTHRRMHTQAVFQLRTDGKRGSFSSTESSDCELNVRKEHRLFMVVTPYSYKESENDTERFH